MGVDGQQKRVMCHVSISSCSPVAPSLVAGKHMSFLQKSAAFRVEIAETAGYCRRQLSQETIHNLRWPDSRESIRRFARIA